MKAIMIGAGARGAKAYGPYATRCPEEIKFIAVAEPVESRRIWFQEQHSIAADHAFPDYAEVLAQGIEADLVFICTPDQLHYQPAKMALEQGYHVVLEKPISNHLEECSKLAHLAMRQNKQLLVCHVLRYTNYFNTLKSLIDSGEIGEVISITHNENVGFFHSAHSYVRGNWRKEATSSPMILAKSCHDIDLLVWLVSSRCTRVSSFGNLKHYRAENAPVGSTMRCLDGCKVQTECPYDAAKIYLDPTVTEWPVSVITEDVHSMDSRIKALQQGPYGRCVYHCDNDVVDHQVVNLEFENGVTVNFSMNSFSSEICRITTVFGTKGQLSGTMESNQIHKQIYLNRQDEIISTKKPNESIYGHGGGDEGLMKSIVAHFSGQDTKSLTTGMDALQSHQICFAIEQARKEGSVVAL